MFLAEYRWPCEPYLLGMTKNIPLYDERFVHYGNDKAQHVLNIFYQVCACKRAVARALGRACLVSPV